MPSTDAATGKGDFPVQDGLSAKPADEVPFVPAGEHYDLLIAEGNDPVLDPPALQRYMDGWDGEALFDALLITPACRVLEIGVGSGRLALRALKRGCAHFTGMDLSKKTLEAARSHLAAYEHVSLVQGEFPEDAPGGPFERIYSSLTFMHIQDKEAACRKIAALLAPGGVCALSLDKDQSGVIDMGVRKIRVYPDTPEEICRLMREAGLQVRAAVELERAWLVIAEKPELLTKKSYQTLA